MGSVAQIVADKLGLHDATLRQKPVWLHGGVYTLAVSTMLMLLGLVKQITLAQKETKKEETRNLNSSWHFRMNWPANEVKFINFLSLHKC